MRRPVSKLYKKPAPLLRNFLLAALTISAFFLIIQSLPAQTSGATTPGLREAVERYYAGSFEQSLLLLEALFRKDPGNPAVLTELIRLHQEAGSYERAAFLLGQLWQLRGGDTETALFSGLVLGRFSERAETLLPLGKDTADSVFYEALLAMNRNQADKAIDLFRKALSLNDDRAASWYFLGKLLLPAQAPEAETCLRTALRIDSSFTAVYPLLAEAVLSQNKYAEGYALLRRVRNIFPGRKDIPEIIAEIARAHPEIGEKTESTAALRRKVAEPPRVTPFPDTAEGFPPVRIALAEGLSSVALKTGSSGRLKYSREDGSEEQIDVGSEILHISSSALDPVLIEVRNETDSLLVSARGKVRLELTDPSATLLLFDFLSEAGSFYAVSEDRSYRGVLDFHGKEKGLTVINTVNLEEYLYSVIPSEMPATWPREALRSQAIAARSYTLASLQGADKDFDVYGSVLSAAYRGVGSETPMTQDAVDSTCGEYLKSEKGPLMAYYSANHGGYSEDSLAVWGRSAFMAAVPDLLLPLRVEPLSPDALTAWLESAPPTYSSLSPYYYRSAYRWEKWVSPEEILSRIGTEAGIGKITSILTRGRGISGRVREVEIIGTDGSVRYSGDRVRSRLGSLRSNLFVVRPKMGPDGYPEFFIFTGAGWGHGVGLDQSGAAGMAAAGFTAEEILLHYYPMAQLSGIPAGLPEAGDEPRP